jgi:anti-sigma regulatory factor (Ser/Thr protein kinase)
MTVDSPDGAGSVRAALANAHADTNDGAGEGVRTWPAATPRAPMLRVLPGTPQAASTARQLALQLLGAHHPATDTVMLLISELVTNAIVHTRSGVPGGTLTLALCPGAAGVLIQVCDAGGPSEPCLSAIPADGAENGYGLLLVDALADSWGTLTSPEGRVTWCRVGGGTPRRR